MSFVEWVCTRRPGGNPRGDFIQDTRALVAAGISEEEIEQRMTSHSREAADEYHRLRREYDRLVARGAIKASEN